MSLRYSELPPGEVVAERYEILEVLGQGASGTVYRARDLHLDGEQEIVALKTIHAQYLSDRQIFGRFRREAKILQRLEGKNLCRLLDFVEQEDLLLIALEYVNGPSLEAYLDQHGPLPPLEIATIMQQVCCALTDAHERGVIHRDLKPANVLIHGGAAKRGDDGPPPSFLHELSARVVDFGLAKVLHGDVVGTVLTEQDMIFGTPDYMAPEQVRGDELDERCDVYAAGVMLYELMVGEVPFVTRNPLTTMAAHMNQQPPVPSSEAPDRAISPALDGVILKALAKERDDRFDSAAAFSAAVTAALEDNGDFVGQEPTEVASSEHDTELDAESVALHTTMPSRENLELESNGQVAKASIEVRDAEPSSKDGEAERLRRRVAMRAGNGADRERQLWALAALVAAVVAVTLGVLAGAR